MKVRASKNRQQVNVILGIELTGHFMSADDAFSLSKRLYVAAKSLEVNLNEWTEF